MVRSGRNTPILLCIEEKLERNLYMDLVLKFLEAFQPQEEFFRMMMILLGFKIWLLNPVIGLTVANLALVLADVTTRFCRQKFINRGLAGPTIFEPVDVTLVAATFWCGTRLVTGIDVRLVLIAPADSFSSVASFLAHTLLGLLL